MSKSDEEHRSSLDGELVGQYSEEDRERMRTDGHAIVICSCPSGPYIGARKSGTPDRCERCGFMTQDQWDAIVIEILSEVENALETASAAAFLDGDCGPSSNYAWGKSLEIVRNRIERAKSSDARTTRWP